MPPIDDKGNVYNDFASSFSRPHKQVIGEPMFWYHDMNKIILIKQ